jgi:hypothetical protein
MSEYEIIDYNWTVEWVFGDNTQAFKEGKKFYVDWEDFVNHVVGYSFYRDKHGYVIYSSAKDGLNNKKLHRIIMNCPDDMVIDHKDHNPLNNSRSNLRIVTNQQNQMNASKRKDNKSGIVGVYWHRKAKKWQASIMLNKKPIHLGLFDNLEDASQVRKEAEIKYFGDYRNKDNE